MSGAWHTAEVDPMPDEPQDAPTSVGDMSDVVTGPIGDARLVVPARSEDRGTDLAKLPAIDVTDAKTADQQETSAVS
jgi:hypothetical protein